MFRNRCAERVGNRLAFCDDLLGEIQHGLQDETNPAVMDRGAGLSLFPLVMAELQCAEEIWIVDIQSLREMLRQDGQTQKGA